MNLTRYHGKKIVKILIFLFGIYTICINLFVLFSFSILLYCKEIRIIDFISSLIWVTWNVGGYWLIYRYFICRKVYKMLNHKYVCVLYTYHKEYTINKKDIVSQKLCIRSIIKVHWKISANIDGKKKIFYTEQKLI